MTAKGNLQWLSANLAEAVGWEEGMMQGVAEAIAAAGSKEEVDELVKDYLGGGEKVEAVVAQYLGQGATKQPQDGSRKGGTLKAPSRGFVELHSGSTRPTGASQRPAGSMTIIHKADKRKGAAAAGPAKPEGPRVDRKVANCLCCGKVYMLQEGGSDVKRLIEAEGACTFCGAHIALQKGQNSECRPPAAERAAAAGSSGSGSNGAVKPAPPDTAAPEQDAAIAEAIAFKDRLVDYDRNAAKRTTVIDDQSDFFEIDSNAWLSDEERAQLKERERLIAEAEASRRSSVRVTFDLLGRQVIMADEAGPSSSSSENARLAAEASAATLAERPQGGGTAARAAAAAAGVDDYGMPGGGAPMVLRIRPSPNLSGPPPVFMRQAHGKEAAQKGSKQAGSSAAAKEEQPQSRPQRLQHDDLFTAFQGLTVSS